MTIIKTITEELYEEVKAYLVHKILDSSTEKAFKCRANGSNRLYDYIYHKVELNDVVELPEARYVLVDSRTRERLSYELFNEAVARWRPDFLLSLIKELQEAEELLEWMDMDAYYAEESVREGRCDSAMRSILSLREKLVQLREEALRAIGRYIDRGRR